MEIRISDKVAAWLIDQFLIMFFYISIGYLLFPYKLPYLGSTFVIVFDTFPSEYAYIEDKHLNYAIAFVLYYLLVNNVYYLICRFFSKKKTIGYNIIFRNLKKVSFVSKSNQSIGWSILKRKFFFILIVLFSWAFTNFLNLPYFLAIIMNLLILYIPVFVCNLSILDYMTGTQYVFDSDIKQKMNTDNLLVNENKKFELFYKLRGIIFPFKVGINRLIIVVWTMLVSLISFIDYHIYEYEYDYGRIGIIILVFAIIYSAIIWVYNGFKKQ